MANKKTEDS